MSPFRTLVDSSLAHGDAKAKQVPGRMGMTEEERLIELEQRMARVEKHLADMRAAPARDLKAPFRVLDSKGSPIFGVYDVNGERSVIFYGKELAGSIVMEVSANGMPSLALKQEERSVAELSINGDTGSLRLSSSGGAELVSLGRSGGGGGLSLTNNGTEIAYVGASDKGGGRMALGDPGGGKAVAAGWNGQSGDVCAATKSGAPAWASVSR